NRQESVALAVIAPATVDVEAEPAGIVIPDFRFMRCRECPTDLVKCLQMSCGVGSGGPGQWRLVEYHNLGDVAADNQFLVRSGIRRMATDPLPKSRVQGLLYQSALARAADARHGAEDAERKVRIDRFQVVATGSLESNDTLGSLATAVGREHTLAAGKVFAR